MGCEVFDFNFGTKDVIEDFEKTQKSFFWFRWLYWKSSSTIKQKQKRYCWHSEGNAYSYKQLGW